jgi:hypothetical protein
MSFYSSLCLYIHVPYHSKNHTIHQHCSKCMLVLESYNHKIIINHFHVLSHPCSHQISVQVCCLSGFFPTKSTVVDRELCVPIYLHAMESVCTGLCIWY